MTQTGSTTSISEPWCATPTPSSPLRFTSSASAGGTDAARLVTDRYQHVRHHESIGAFATWASSQGLEIIGIDIDPDAEPLERTTLPRRSVLLFGQEGPGLSPEARAVCVRVCSIAQFGSTRSINAGVASGIAMHTWIRRHVSSSEG